MDSFSADLVPRHFNLTPDKTLEHAAMRFMFHMIKRDLQTAGENPTPKEIAMTAIGTIETRYKLLHKYKDNFFDGQTPNHQALTLAVICDYYVRDMADLAKNKDHALPGHPIDMTLVHQARKILDHACNYAFCKPSKTPRPAESLFLAHLNIYDDILNIVEECKDYPLEELHNMLTREIPCAHHFLKEDTAIGQDLQEILTDAKEVLTCYMDSLPPLSSKTVTKRQNRPPVLTVVPNPGTP